MKRDFFGHPAGLFTLFFTEMWERFSYYGMRAILVLFMTAELAERNPGMGMSTLEAGAIYGLYTSAVYLLTLPGGWLADNVFGQRKTIWYGGIVIMLGHISLAVPSDMTFYFGLVLVAVGTGLLKANISTIVGDLYPESGARRDAGFSIFYMGINIGSFAGQMIVGYLGEAHNWHWGFGAAAVGMFLGLVVYRLTAPNYLGNIGIVPKAREVRQEEASVPVVDRAHGAGKKFKSLPLILLGAIIALIATLHFTGAVDLNTVVGLAQAMGYAIVAIAASYFIYVLTAGGLDKVQKRRVYVIICLFVGAALFWSGFEQAGSSLNLFAERHTERFFGPAGVAAFVPIVAALLTFAVLGTIWYNRILSNKTLIVSLKLITGLVVIGVALFVWWIITSISEGWQMPASWLQSINPMFIIIFAPIIGAVWVKLAARNMSPSAPLKFGFGLILLGLGFLMMVLASRIVVSDLEGSVRVSALWLVMTYFLHTIGELTLSPIGLSMTTKLAPKKFAGQMMGIWFIGAALGNLIAGLFAGNFEEDNVSQMPDLFMTTVLVSVGSGLLFVAFSKPIKKWMGGVE
jgi:POT family proton-dependent oligopeptide transporter